MDRSSVFPHAYAVLIVGYSVEAGRGHNDSPLSGGLLTSDSGATSAGSTAGAAGAASSTHSMGGSTASAFFVHPLHAPRANLAAASTDDGYAIGGSEASWGCTVNSTSYAVERMDPSSGEWVIGPALLTPRCGPAAAASQSGSVFAFGGWDGSAAQASVRSHDGQLGSNAAHGFDTLWPRRSGRRQRLNLRRWGLLNAQQRHGNRRNL